MDPNKFGSNTIQQLIKFKPDAVFVSVPTPQLESGECNSEIVESVLQELNQAKDLLVIIKSTVPAYKLQSIKEQCINLRIVYNPEFLTEKNYINDFKNPPMHLFGGAIKDTEEVEQLYTEFSSCKKCMEYTNEERYSYEYVYDNQFGYIYNQIVDSVRSPNIEICRDNFESKKLVIQ